MPKPKLRPPGETTKIVGVSFATVRQWIYKGKLRTVKTLDERHRVLEDDMEKRLRFKRIAESRKKWGLGPQKFSAGKLGCIVDIKFDGLIAQVTILTGDYERTSLITAGAASEPGLGTGDRVIALLKSSRIMILREPF